MTRRATLTVGGCALLALVGAVVSVGSGQFPMSPATVVRTLAGGGTPADALVVDQLRLPRAVTALLTGGALGLSGAVFQSVVRNPLGSPDLLGFTTGAATGALVAIVTGGGVLLVSFGAVAGAVLTGLAIYLVAWRSGLHVQRLVLAGIGVGAALTGVNGYLLTHSQIDEAAQAVIWLTGSLSGATWSSALPLAVVVGLALPVLAAGCGQGLRIMEMGDDAATALGVRVSVLRPASLAVAVLLAGFAAAAAGPVAFVALAAPQLARRLTRLSGPNLVPSCVLGATLMVAADLAGQRLVPSGELPVGVMTGVLGGVFLIWLLIRERKAQRL